jgi:hypothetical protein
MFLADYHWRMSALPAYHGLVSLLHLPLKAPA